MSEELSLAAVRRDSTGKKAAKNMRREGNIPGVYYFHGQEAIPVLVNAKDAKLTLASDSTVINLKLDGTKRMPAIVREVQRNPITGAAMHIDFLGVKLDEKVTVDVVIHTVGTPVGVKLKGGTLQLLQRSIELECLPMDIPDSIEIDVSELDVHDSITAASINVENVTIITDPTAALVSVLPPRLAEAEEEAEEGETAEPEVVGKDKEEK